MIRRFVLALIVAIGFGGAMAAVQPASAAIMSGGTNTLTGEQAKPELLQVQYYYRRGGSHYRRNYRPYRYQYRRRYYRPRYGYGRCRIVVRRTYWGYQRRRVCW